MKREQLIQKIVDIKPPRALLISLLADAMLLIQEYEKARKRSGKERWATDPKHIAYQEIKKNWKMLQKRNYFKQRGNKSNFIKEILDIYENEEVELNAEYLKKLMLEWELEFKHGDIASSLTDSR